MRIFALYFSGTGNTKYAVKQFLSHFEGSEMHSIEERMDFAVRSDGFDTILVAHPIYGSDMPLPMRDFLREHKAMFSGKDLITLATQYLFSGDGGALAYRMVRREARRHMASLHINMPSNVNFPPLIRIQNGQAMKGKLAKANRKVDECAGRIQNGGRIRNGKGPLCFLLGYFMQRLWYRLFVFGRYQHGIRIDQNRCIGCGLCAGLCPVENLEMTKKAPVPQDRCVLCYRCVNRCPKKAITLFSKADSVVQYEGIECHPTESV
ncbi:EFR1 family ferrodoxin [Mesotoga sp.]|uniref:EFR1 family ferrodoxin n=1 Tax=Mesotoga sp. TaxID=2053577 RepID=UPI00345E3A87